MLLEKAKVLVNERIRLKADYYLMELAAPGITERAKPGQFLMITPAAQDSPFLKRPMGINGISRNNGCVRIIYQVKGKGTRVMTGLRSGDTVELLGPLGNGWHIPPAAQRALMVGGGTGIASILPLAKEIKMRGVLGEIVLGAASAEDIICKEDFTIWGDVHIATEDGSLGERGRLDIFLNDRTQPYDMVYACGPVPMMRFVAEWARGLGLPCQVSMEERMGCGFGVCMGCVCETKSGDGPISYKRVCREGPVFDAREVFFNG
ncbi:MAG: dihydroorotate dehydrogenase electron transfer subunit [Bacillota bacterium]|nr:dihydroorotate dehydrogenase electron transfer subunit [Bacillota bacterium]